jgi:hypothetical protein
LVEIAEIDLHALTPEASTVLRAGAETDLVRRTAAPTGRFSLFEGKPENEDVIAMHAYEILIGGRILMRRVGSR